MRSGRFITLIFLFLTIIIFQCETKERFYRPDVPQKLCTIGILDTDDTTIYDLHYSVNHDTITFGRRISFEKSFQFEFPEEMNDSIRDLSLTISDENTDLFKYHSNSSEFQSVIKIPTDLNFESGKKYLFNASDEEAGNISAEIRVPEQPSSISLLDVTDHELTLTSPPVSTCHGSPWGDLYARNSEIEFSFLNTNPDSYYAIMVLASVNDTRTGEFLSWGTNILNFSVQKGNANGFFCDFLGRKTFQIHCRNENSWDYLPFPVQAYFIDGNSISGENCTLRIRVQYAYGDVQDFIKCFRIKLLSIPRELYLFEKSLYTYQKSSNDPFAEPGTLEGNIKGGNGIFAICRSRELIVYKDAQRTRFF